MKKVLLVLVVVLVGAALVRRAAARHRATPHLHLHGTPDRWPAVVRKQPAATAVG